MKENFKLAVLGIGLVAFSSCGTARTRDEASMSKVKSVAVVAFSVEEPTSAKISFNVNSHKTQAAEGGSMIPENDDHTDKMYAELSQRIGSATKWKVMPAAAMVENEGYTKAFDSTMKGFQNKMGPGGGRRQFLVKDVMDYDALRILSPAERDTMIRALGVDAVVVARIDVQVNGTTVMGIGSRHPQSVLSFKTYALGNEKPIWSEINVKGKESEQSVGSTGFIDEKLLGDLALVSAESALPTNRRIADRMTD